MTDIISKVLLAIAIVLAGWQTWQLGEARSAEAKAVAALAQYQQKASDNLTGEVITVRANEQGMQETASVIRKNTNESVQATVAEHDALLKRLRVAEANLATARLMSSVAYAASPGAASPGGDEPELPARIGEADVREAKRGETIRLHLASCYAHYESARSSRKPVSGTPLSPP